MLRANLILLATVALGLAGCSQTEEPEAAAIPANGILECREGDLLYAYQLVSATESLYDTEADPERLRNLVETRPGDAARLRRRLAERYGVDDLEELRESRRDKIEQLERLGYL